MRMENPYNPMMITVLVRFSGRINRDSLRMVMEEMVSRYRRFRQLIVRPNGPFQRPYWEDDPGLRIENHIEHVNLHSPADETAVIELVNTKMNTSLDFDHPLWKITITDDHPDGSIIIVRVHHCIADGISLMHVLLQMTKIVSAEGIALSPLDLAANAGSPEVLDEVVTPTMIQAMNGTQPSQPEASVKSGRSLVHHKPNAFDLIAAAVRIVVRSADPPTILKGPLGPVKKAVWSEPLSVPAIKKIAQYKGATINDTLMAVATGATRRYMDLHKDDRKRNVRAFILVNMRGRTVDDELGNKFGLVFLTMPIDQTQPMARLDKIKQGMDLLKASAEYAASYIILNILGLLPKWIEDLAIKILDTKGTVVATNVPGSRRLLFLAGAPIQSMIAWVPQSGRIGVGLSFVSYNDQLVVGLNVDAGLIPDPEVFLQLFGEEYLALQEAVSASTEE